MAGGRRVDVDSAANASFQLNGTHRPVVGDRGGEGIEECHSPSVDAVAMAGRGHLSRNDEDPVNSIPERGDIELSPSSARGNNVRGIGGTHEVIEAATELVKKTSIQGISEVAGLVVILMNLVNDRADMVGVADNTKKRCRSRLFFFLQLAVDVLQEVSRGVAELFVK